jgi:hypothetical protein
VSDFAETLTMPTRLPGGSVALHPRHLHQRTGRNGDPHMSGEFLLKERKKTAVGGDRLGPLGHEIGGGVEEILKQSGRTVQHDLLGAGTLDHAVQHGKRPSGGVAHVAGDAGELRLQHQDAEGGAVDGLAAFRDGAHAAS